MKFHDYNNLIGQQKEFIQVFSHMRCLPIKAKDNLHYQTDTAYWCLPFCWIYGPMTSKASNYQIRVAMGVIILVLISLWTQEYVINIRFLCMSLEMIGTYSLSDERWQRIWLVDFFFGVFVFIFSNYFFCSLWKYTKFVESFIKNVLWILSDSFYASIVMILWFSSFVLLMWCIILIVLWILKHSCILGINPLVYGVWSFSGIVEFSLL